MMQYAFARLYNGRPGPVTLKVPIDVLGEETDPALLDDYRPALRSAPVADPAEIGMLKKPILHATHPVIVAGQGILYGQACEELRLLAELAHIPIISTLNGKGGFPETHPLSLGCAGSSRPDPVNHCLDKSDLIVELGTSFTQSDYITPFPTNGRQLIQLTNNEEDIGKSYPIDLGLIGDVKSTLVTLIDSMMKHRMTLQQKRVSFSEEIKRHTHLFMSQWAPCWRRMKDRSIHTG